MNTVDVENIQNFNIKVDLKKVACFALDYQKVKSSHMSIVLCSSAEIREYNKKYRSLDNSTDVLSFAFKDSTSFEFYGIDKDELGEIYISPDDVLQNAKDAGVSDIEEFARVTIHGVLHLLGFDHKTNEASEQMLLLQEKILEELKAK